LQQQETLGHRWALLALASAEPPQAYGRAVETTVQLLLVTEQAP
jgi:hypothetical protein